jgi:hypothetical protein
VRGLLCVGGRGERTFLDGDGGRSALWVAGAERSEVLQCEEVCVYGELKTRNIVNLASEDIVAGPKIDRSRRIYFDRTFLAFSCVAV